MEVVIGCMMNTKRFLSAIIICLLVRQLNAQTEAILNDPDVVWASWIELLWNPEPETETTSLYRQNRSVVLKNQANTTAIYPSDTSRLAFRLLEGAKQGRIPSFNMDRKSHQLTPCMAEDLAQIGSQRDTFTVIDPVTTLLITKVVENTIDWSHFNSFLVQQLLYFRESTGEFEIMPYAFSPIEEKYKGGNFVFSRPTVWFKVPFSKKNPSPNLNNPSIPWARRLTSLDSFGIFPEELRPAKDFRPPVMNEVFQRVKTSEAYGIFDATNTSTIPFATRKKDFLTVTEQVTIFDPETYEEVELTTVREWDAVSAPQLYLSQDWWWDDKCQCLQMRMYAFAPVYPHTLGDGTKLHTPLFWKRNGR